MWEGCGRAYCRVELGKAREEIEGVCVMCDVTCFFLSTYDLVEKQIDRVALLVRTTVLQIQTEIGDVFVVYCEGVIRNLGRNAIYGHFSLCMCW